MRAISFFVAISGIRAVSVAARWRRSWVRRPSRAQAGTLAACRSFERVGGLVIGSPVAR